MDVIGPVSKEDIPFQNALNDWLRMHYTKLGEYRPAPDPATALKARFSRDAPVLASRTAVVWCDCSE